MMKRPRSSPLGGWKVYALIVLPLMVLWICWTSRPPAQQQDKNHINKESSSLRKRNSISWSTWMGSRENNDDDDTSSSDDDDDDSNDDDDQDWNRTYLDAEFRRPGGLLDHNPPPQYPRTMFLYILAQVNGYQVHKVQDLAKAFGQNFLVIWGNTEQPNCPVEIMAIANCVDDWILSDSKRELTRNSCCGIQKAVAWSVFNRYSFDYLWMMEEDVHFTSISEVTSVVYNQYDNSLGRLRRPYQDTADLVLQMPLVDLSYDSNPLQWNKKRITRYQFREDMKWLDYAMVNQHHAFSMLNLFRVSRKFLTHVEMVFHDSQNQYGFFESFFPTLARVYDLQVDTWPYQVSTNHERPLMVGPCWQGSAFREQAGIYHPAKWDAEQQEWVECNGVSFDPKDVLAL